MCAETARICLVLLNAPQPIKKSTNKKSKEKVPHHRCVLHIVTDSRLLGANSASSS